MKITNKIFILFLVLVFTILSCEKDFLKETPYTKATPGELYTTKKGINSGLNGLYASLRNLYGTRNTLYLCEGPSDLWVSYYGPHYVQNWTWDAESGWVENFWNDCYQAINQCNEVASALENNKIDGLSGDLKKQYLAEAKFIRAHYFYHLVQQFGDVPMPLEPTKSPKTTATREDKDKVWEQIITDLKFAGDNLPGSYSNSNYGKATKYAAMHNLSKALLTVKRNDQDIVDALDYAEKIINSGQYSLVDSHKKLWAMENQVNSEVIFPVLYSQDSELNPSGNHKHLFYVCAYFEEHPGVKRALEYGRGWSRLKPTYFALDLFDNPNDVRYEQCFVSEWDVTVENVEQTLFNPNTKEDEVISWDKGDLAMIAPPGQWTKEQIEDVWPVSVYLPDSMRNYINPKEDIQSADRPNAPWPSNTRFRNVKMYPYIVKHMDPWRPHFNDSRGSKDVFVFRLGETYLLAAEAAYLAGDPQKAAKYINVVRRRAASPGEEDAMEINASEVDIDFILNERGRELIGESKRWYDLKRTGKVLERMTDPNIYYQNPDKVKEYHLLRPIPRDQLSNVTNRDEFPQNPGYGD